MQQEKNEMLKQQMELFRQQLAEAKEDKKKTEALLADEKARSDMLMKKLLS